ncbi:hypothetical protein [Kordia sp.]|uniref:hypothetical protein n=1 Tax=Kordia sp. TaxID=1965332 RepID=UPI003B595758
MIEEFIKERIIQLETYVTNLRTMITKVNKEILAHAFVPNALQKAQISYYASQGRRALKSIEILKLILLQNTSINK